MGATPETDLEIMKLSAELYGTMRLKRVYYSAYIPVNRQVALPNLGGPPLARENRLYQADWLLRFYGFTVDELLDPEQPNFDTTLDPKVCWAVKHPAYFPIEINKADYQKLLRVPGIGVRSALRILTARKARPLKWEELRRLGVVIKRARYFITVSGKQDGAKWLADPAQIKRQLMAGTQPRPPREEQLWLFSPAETKTETSSVVTGEL